MTLDGLYRAVAARSALSVLVGRGTEVLAVWLIRLVCFRVRRIETQILLLLEKFQAGTLVIARPRTQAVRVGRGGGGLKGVRRAEGKVPRRFAWLLPLVPCEAANYASQLRLWLAEPEMVALLRASAQARRALAPVCRMLGIEAEMLTPSGEIVAKPPAEDHEVARAWNLGVVRRMAAGPPPGHGASPPCPAPQAVQSPQTGPPDG